MRRTWLIFSQATTVVLAGYFVVATLKPEWLHGASPQVPVSAQDLGGRPGYSLAAKRASPAVVSVMASKMRRLNDADQAQWRRYHRDRNVPAELPAQTGLGSGVIVSPQGFVLTNEHVVEDASEFEVQLADGRQTQAELVGTDPETDLAVLRIRLPNLPVVQLGNVATLQVGDAVLAIGYPFNVGQTVTSGIVSALGRHQLGLNTFENFIQTDAAINPGNSGGALVDAEGQLLGINTAIYSRTGGSMGIGFAIPLSTAKDVMEALIRDGQVARGWIGVQTRELTPELLQALKLPDLRGVLVSGLVTKGPAARAGVKAGDVVTAVAGRPVQNPEQMLAAVAALRPQAQAELSLQRGQEALRLKLQVGQRPKPQPEPAPAPAPDTDPD
ncbi:MAG: trypsin-like peptidase domain-containing protein [Burkholderiaceae bacterium]|nr:trypsin-like peptidase domain-containing protein [Burkholderiaceae bacterium]